MSQEAKTRAGTRGKAMAAPPKRRRARPRKAAAPKGSASGAGVERSAWRKAGEVVVATALGLAAMVSMTLFIVYPMGRGPGAGDPVEVRIPENSSPAKLARQLADAGLVSMPGVFALWLRATGGTRDVAPGLHLLTDDSSPRELMARLERRGRGGIARITFPEGWNRFEMARRLQDRRVVALREFLDATVDPALLHELGVDGDSAEGFLFPATYDLPLDDEAREVVRTMKREFDRRWDALGRAHGSTLADVMASADLTVANVVTLASMVEKEAAVDDERPLIASVFLNRLRDPAFRPRRLECDPTASYGCLVAPEKAASCAAFTGRPTAAIEHDADNPYSTYTHEGLPPGPIANPGAKSLEAVMAPSASRYFFFVAKGEGRHTFSETYGAHVAAVREAVSRPGPPGSK
ncbi:MAG TPA: endolytic transglycosylase MltG [Polyangiaceae bacterium]|nr:endolytic transglycosylase MltG [Polyangiaceae bacterium]